MKTPYYILLAVYIITSLLYSSRFSSLLRIILQILATVTIASAYYKAIKVEEDIMRKGWALFLGVLTLVQCLFMLA